MAITIPHLGKGDFTSSQSSLSVSFAASASSAIGSLIVAAGMFQPNATTVTLSNGHSDIVIDSGLGLIVDGSSEATFLKYFPTPVAGTTTITATYSGGTNPTYGDMFIWEIAGLTRGSLDRKVSANGSGTPIASGTTSTLQATDEAIIAYFTSNNAVLSVSSPLTDDGLTINTGSRGAHNIVAVNTAVNAQATNASSTGWRAWCATFASGAQSRILTLAQAINRSVTY